MESIFFLPNEKKKIKILSSINTNNFIKCVSKITNSFVVYNNGSFEKIYIFEDNSYAGSVDKLDKKSIIIFKNKSDNPQNVDLGFKFEEIKEIQANKKKLKEEKSSDEEDTEEVKNGNNLNDINKLKMLYNSKSNLHEQHDEFNAAKRYFENREKNKKEIKNIKNVNKNTLSVFRKCIFELKEYLSLNINNIDEYLDNKANDGNIIFILKNFCKVPSNTSNVSLMFNFDETSKHLCIFHYKLIGIIKKYFEYMISRNSKYKKFNLNIYVKITKMTSNEIGSTKIKNHVEAIDDQLSLPKEAILRLNKNKLTKNPKDPLNIDFVMLLFHELLHCYGFGYWNLMDIKNYKKTYYENFNNSVYSVDDIFYSLDMMYFYNNLFNCNQLISCPMEKGSHFSENNRLILRNAKPYKILPSLNNELMCLNKNKYNCLSIISAGALEAIGYNVDFSLCDKYYIDPLALNTQINYTKISRNHYYNGHSKHMLILSNKDEIFVGNKTYSIEIGRTYTFYNNHEWSIYVMKSLFDDEKYYCSEKEGVRYYNDRVIITPNNHTPEIIYIVSSITFGGVPLVVRTNDYNEEHSIQNLFKSLLESF